MAISTINIGKTEILFVFRHRFEKAKTEFNEWRCWELGLWYRRYKVVGKKNFRKPDDWHKYLVNQHIIGINLLICKAWISICQGGMNIPEK